MATCAASKIPDAAVAPVITTIIPTYRRPQSLRRAIESALAQTYRDLVIRVFDNASGDETEQVVAALAAADPRVRYVCRPRNIGAAENFIQAAAGIDTPLCSFLSDDDRLLPEFYAAAVAALATRPQAGMFAGSTLEFDESGLLQYAPLLWWPRQGVYEPAEAVLRMLGNRHPTWTGIVFRTQTLRDAGGLDPVASATLDLDAELRVAARAPIVVSFVPCAVYVSHAGSVSAGETAAVIPGYERIIANIATAPGLPLAVKKRACARLQRQLRAKLLEISVKAQVRRDPSAARAAALLLRDRYGPRWLGAALMLMSASCRRVPLIQRLLEWLEARRLRVRAATARRMRAERMPDPNGSEI